MADLESWKLAGLRRRAQRHWPTWLLVAFIVGLLGLLMSAEPYTAMDVPLPELEMRVPGGERLRKADLVGKPWLVNVWLPG